MVEKKNEIGLVEEEITLLKNTYEHGSYEYNNPLENFTKVTNSHFKNVNRKGKYGIYIIRKRDIRDILYIGKSGTIDNQGRFKSQTLPGRLKNVKKNDVTSNKWFKDLFQEKGPLSIEYIFLPLSKSPAFVESLLLQTFLNEYHRLPYKNNEL